MGLRTLAGAHFVMEWCFVFASLGKALSRYFGVGRRFSLMSWVRSFVARVWLLKWLHGDLAVLLEATEVFLAGGFHRKIDF